MRAGIVGQEVRLDDNPLTGQSTFGKLLLGELGGGDVPVNLPLPCTTQIMIGEHERDDTGLGDGIMVASVHHARPRKSLADATFAYFAVTEERRLGTDQAIILDGLHHRDPMGMTHIICCRRDEGERIRKVRDLRLHLLNQA